MDTIFIVLTRLQVDRTEQKKVTFSLLKDDPRKKKAIEPGQTEWKAEHSIEKFFYIKEVRFPKACIGKVTTNYQE